MHDGLLEHIYRQLDRAALLRELAPSPRGNTIALACPACGKREAYIYADGAYIQCNRRNKCGYGVTLWDYIAHRDNLSPQETLRALAKAAGVPLPERDQGAAYAQEAGRQALLARAIAAMQAALFTPQGEATLAYLQRRGWAAQAARSAGFGHYLRPGQLRAALLEGQPQADLSAVDSQDFSLFAPAALGDTHTLAIPFCDPYGRPRGIIARSTEPLAPDKSKYLFNRGARRGEHLFHLETAGRAETLVVVEGYIDALMAHAQGIPGVVSVGGSRLSAAQLDEAVRRGARRFVLALDNADTDRAGRDGALAAVRAIHQAGARAYIAPLPEGIKDPDEWMRQGAAGVAGFRAAIENPLGAPAWAAQRLLQKHGVPLPAPGQPPAPLDAPLRDRVLDEAMAFAGAFQDPVSPADYLQPIARALDLPRHTLQLAYQAHLARLQQAKRTAQLKKLAQEISQRAAEEQTEGLDADIRARLDSMAQQQGVTLRPYTLDELRMDLARAPDGLRTGYESLDALLTVPQGAITLVAARPSHGKTTLLTNLFLRMIQTYPQGSFAFFSYEETRAALALNMLNILAGKTLHRRKNKYAISQYFARGEDMQALREPALDAAWQTFGQWVDEGRLQLFEDALDADALASLIVREKQRNPGLTAVFIDYMQKIRWNGAPAPSRQVELQRISGRLLQAAKRAEIPIILAAQLGRPAKGRDVGEDTRRGVRLDNLRESGDIEQDANLVLGLFNEAMHRGEEDAREVNAERQMLTVTILKNRNGVAGGHVDLLFEPQILRVSDMKPVTVL
ncbi:MAG: toprim domain-containing protein [Oscillospiraceae bacterium]|jgi:replicative DNA helicase|nr:toprim domain-containing protein [Oscillospiraceae bacterium]